MWSHCNYIRDDRMGILVPSPRKRLASGERPRNECQGWIVHPGPSQPRAERPETPQRSSSGYLVIGLPDSRRHGMLGP
jgi:hypothetical protein